MHSFFVKLKENLVESEVKDVCLEKDKKRELEMFQNRSEDKADFQKVESDLASSRSNEFFEVALERF
jgi:hypothetical protein